MSYWLAEQQHQVNACKYYYQQKPDRPPGAVKAKVANNAVATKGSIAIIRSAGFTGSHNYRLRALLSAGRRDWQLVHNLFPNASGQKSEVKCSGFCS